MTPSQIQEAAARFANSDIHNEKSGRPDNVKVESESSEEGTLMLPMESPSPALSDATVQTDFDSKQNGLFSDLVGVNGSGYSGPDYNVFPGFDDFGGDFYVPPSYDYGEENMDGLIIHDSFLWNF